jgi:hypothetical protein
MSRTMITYSQPSGLAISHPATALPAGTLNEILVHLGLEALYAGDMDRVRLITDLLRERRLADA